jgi:hypothetical protein
VGKDEWREGLGWRYDITIVEFEHGMVLGLLWSWDRILSEHRRKCSRYMEYRRT